MNAQSGGRRAAIWGAGIFLLTIALLIPAWVNRRPVMYPDSVGYFHSGYAAIKQISAHLGHHAGGVSSGAPLTPRQADGVTTARSVYYGFIYVVTYLLAGVWGLAAGQVLLTLACLLLAARRTISLDLLPWFGALIGIVLLSGLNIFTVTAMPDLFAGLMLLAVAIILAYAPDLPRLEYGFWLALIFAACLFHKAHLAILALVLMAVICMPFLWRKRGRDLLLLAGTAVVALAGHYAVDLTVRRETGSWPISPPFALARLVGDGTAEKYLRQVCPMQHFATCAYLGKMPMTENDFLWSREDDKSVMSGADRQTRAAIATESNDIVWGTLAAYPLEEAAAAARNVTAQLGDVGVTEYRLLPSDDMSPVPILRWALDQYRDTAIAKGWMPLAAISALMRGVYFAALVGIGSLFWRRRGAPGRGDPAVRFVLLLLIGVVANAVVSGAIAGVFDRYQGRVAWLVSFGFAVLAARLLSDQRSAAAALKGS